MNRVVVVVNGAIAQRRKAVAREFGELLMTHESALYLAQLGRCFHCGGFMPLVNDKTHGVDERPTRDHLVPMPYRAAYPDEAHAAVVMAHRECNTARADAPPTEEEAERAKLVWKVAAGLIDKHGDDRKSIWSWMKVADTVSEREAQEYAASLYGVHEAQMRIYAAAGKACVRVLLAAGVTPWGPSPRPKVPA